MATRNLIELLRRLEVAKVRFIVIGGMACVMRGAPIVTVDVDIVHDRDAGNVDRLLEVLNSIDAVYRNDQRKLKPTPSHLTGPGHQLLITKLGPIDVLGEVSGAGYAELINDASPMSLGDGIEVYVLSLERLITLKRSAGRPKDHAALPVLEATLQVQREKGRG